MARRRKGVKREIRSYRHSDRERVNNPPVGFVYSRDLFRHSREDGNLASPNPEALRAHSRCSIPARVLQRSPLGERSVIFPPLPLGEGWGEGLHCL